VRERERNSKRLSKAKGATADRVGLDARKVMMPGDMSCTHVVKGRLAQAVLPGLSPMS
jgi:hypothetical protein